MAQFQQQTLFAVDCGATNWRLFRSQYQWTGDEAILIGEPQSSPMTSFNDRKLPAVLMLNTAGNKIESIGEIAQLALEDENRRDLVREYFKPCIGAHLEPTPLPHQTRYTHAQALSFTREMLKLLLNQIQAEKWRSEPFDDRIWFTFAYPIHWRSDHSGEIFKEFKSLVQSSFPAGFNQIRFVAEPEGAILSLEHRGLLNSQGPEDVTLIIDVGGSTTDIISGRIDQTTGNLCYLGRTGAPVGGGLYDAELAKFLADQLNVPASSLAEDPSALVSLRRSGQRLKESLSRQLLSSGTTTSSHQRSITLVLRDGSIYRRTIELSSQVFSDITSHLDTEFQRLVIKSIDQINAPISKINQVLLVGGGSQLHSNINFLRETFGPDKVLLADNPDEIVVQGIGLEYKAAHERKDPTIVFESGSFNNQTPIPPGKILGPEPPEWRLVSSNNEFSLIEGVNTMGRSEANHVQIEDIKASRLHAEITLENDSLVITDKGSTNGTKLNDLPLEPHSPTPLSDRDKIMIGKSTYLIERNSR